MFRKKYLLVIACLMALVCICSFNTSSNIDNKRDCSINLRWIQSYELETWETVQTGMLWNLSFLGAALPEGCTDNVITKIDSTSFTLDLQFAGFTDDALSAFSVIIKKLKTSDEFILKGSIDVGRFIMLTLNSSWHYYKITGAEKNLKDLIQKNSFYKYELFPVFNSSIGKYNRLIKFVVPENIEKATFIAETGIFDTIKNKLQPEGYEVIDIIPNGQLRFAVYNAEGTLIEGSPALHGKAGKPSKCLWCHETNLQIDLKENPSLGNYINYSQFNKKIDSFQRSLDQYRSTLNSAINFTKSTDHTYSEFLYLFFMEPSSNRLMKDWKIDSLDLKNKFPNIVTHRSEEFSFMNNVYHRKDIDQNSPYKGLPVPSFARESNGFEPNYFKEE